MLKLSSNRVVSLGSVRENGVIVRRVSENPDYAQVCRCREYFLVRNHLSQIPEGFAGYLFFEKPSHGVPTVSYLLEPSLSYLRNGDIIKINLSQGTLRTLYRRNSRHNSVLVTERCNNYCLMCSQPPRDINDGHLVDELLQAIPLMSRETLSVVITGGEPTLLGERLVEVLNAFRCYLPDTAVHVLSNGRNFRHFDYARAIGRVQHPDLMVGIPLLLGHFV